MHIIELLEKDNNSMEIIEETRNEIPDSKLKEEKMMAATCDIFHNKGKLSSETLGRFQNSDTFCSKIKRKILNIGKRGFQIHQNSW